jgi:rhamnulokinase
MIGQTIETIHLIGGGCQSGYLTSQTTAICNRRVISGPVEAATIGNILVQAISMGVIPGLKEARRLVKESQSVRTFDPGPTDSSDLASYRKFLELLAQ